MAGDKVHCKEPFAEAYLRVLKYSSDGNRKVFATFIATEGTILAGFAVVLAAERANDIVLIPPRIKDGLLAFILGIKVGREFKNTVKVVEVNHNSKFKVVSSITGIFHFCLKFRINLPISPKSRAGIFDVYCIESVDQFEDYHHFNNIF